MISSLPTLLTLVFSLLQSWIATFSAYPLGVHEADSVQYLDGDSHVVLVLAAELKDMHDRGGNAVVKENGHDERRLESGSVGSANGNMVEARSQIHGGESYHQHGRFETVRARCLGKKALVVRDGSCPRTLPGQ